MAIKHYLIELTTEIPVVVNDKEVSNVKSLYEIVMDKTQEYLNSTDLNSNEYVVKIVAEEYEKENTNV